MNNLKQFCNIYRFIQRMNEAYQYPMSSNSIFYSPPDQFKYLKLTGIFMIHEFWDLFVLTGPFSSDHLALISE